MADQQRGPDYYDELSGVSGLLWLPADERPPRFVVLLLHDALGMDSRSRPYQEQLTGAGIAVLELDLANLQAPASVAVARAVSAMSRDFGFERSGVGGLSFGQGAQALLFAARSDDAEVPRITARAMLYPGCSALLRRLAEAEVRPEIAVSAGSTLLLHGGRDPTNSPTACEALERHLGTAFQIRRIEYPHAGYAWDLYPGSGGQEGVTLVPAPAGSPSRVEVSYWPELAEYSASQVAAFFWKSLHSGLGTSEAGISDENQVGR